MGGALAAAPFAASASIAETGHIDVIVLPKGTTIRQLGTVPGMALGLMSAGIGHVPAPQTYLDITQGNRINRSLYGSGTPKPKLEPTGDGGQRVDSQAWARIVDRASSAPSDLVPGLLASTLIDAGHPPGATQGTGSASVIAADTDGSIKTGPTAQVKVTHGTLRRTQGLAQNLAAGDVLIAITAPPPETSHQLPIGIAGSGFNGELTSESTHTDGLVLATDLAPTILDRLGVEVPDAMAGQPITASGNADAADLADLETRLAEIGPRRHAVIGVNLIIWTVAALLLALVGRRRGFRKALPLLAATLAFAPATMLVAPTFNPSELAERLIVGLGAPAFALAAVAIAGSWGGLALGALVSVGGYGIDVIAGSHLTTLSLMGPNPALGVRFYGIGNELEAMVASLALVGTGAALERWGSELDRARAAWVFGGVGFACVAAFAPGRFGADVGAAIDIPIAGAVAVAVCLRARRTRLLLILAVPLVVLAALAAVDLVTGGDSHLTRSVLQAGGLDNLGNVAERRLRLSALSFSRYASSSEFWIAVALTVLAIVKRRTVQAWFAPAPLAWAGLLGAVAGTIVGTLANDSGALLFMIGAAFVATTAGIAWSNTQEAASESGIEASKPVPPVT